MNKWIDNLEEDEVTFIKKFVLYSGSLKDMAKDYDVSYPTIRLKLDRLIQKIRLVEEQEDEPYVSLIKSMAIDGKIEVEVARVLIAEYRKL